MECLHNYARITKNYLSIIGVCLFLSQRNASSCYPDNKSFPIVMLLLIINVRNVYCYIHVHNIMYLLGQN